MFIHWAPIDRQELSNPAAWSTDVLPASVDVARWMFAFAMQVDGKNGLDIVAGSRGENGSIGWFEAPADARDVEAMAVASAVQGRMGHDFISVRRRPRR